MRVFLKVLCLLLAGLVIAGEARAQALIHPTPEVTDAIWEELPLTTRGDIVDNLQDVPTVSPGRTRAYARELLATLEPE